MTRTTVRRMALALLAAVSLAGCDRPAVTPAFVTPTTGKPVVPGYPLQFPRDHGPHDDYGLEWWYVTANLTDDLGQHHALQWTLFRFRGPEQPASAWWDGQGYLAHLMHESQGVHRAWQRMGRASQARIEAAPFVAGLDHWWLRSESTPFLPLHLVAGESGFNVALRLDDSPLVLHGDRGFSDKSGDGALASYYYSFPRLSVTGHLNAGQGWRPVQGAAWLDREWSSALLDERFVGWDWMGLQLDDGRNLMVFCLQAAAEGADHCDGSLILPSREVITLTNEVIDWDAVAWSELDGIRYPTQWRLSLPEHAISLTIQTRSPDQRNRLDIVYWEGPVVVSGSQTGQGFVEMTGRAQTTR